MNECLYCGKQVKNKYCNVSCQNKHQNIFKINKKYGEIKFFKVICFKCGKEIEIKEREKLHPQKQKYYCSRSCANSRLYKKIIFTSEMKKKMSDGQKKYWTDENKIKRSNLMKKVVERNPEKYSTKNVSGRAKIYNYNGIYLKGTWEVKIAEMLDENKIKWTNEITPIPYYWNNNWHLYFPDFYLTDYKKYIEVKGYERERDLIKWKTVGDSLIILRKKEIKLLKNKEKNIKDYIAGWSSGSSSGS